MAVRTGMFLFEVVVESVKGVTMLDNRGLVIKSDFANIFSLELKDPKQMHIVMPEPLPLPPEPVGKKGKKKKKKPKPKKGKKGKKGKIELPPPEPVIQSGQSVLFPSSAEILIQNMKTCPLELSVWSKEEHLVYIGATSIPWDPSFLTYLSQVANCLEPPPVTINDEYNIFEEGKGKLLAKVAIQIKLSFLNNKLTTAFRTLSEDPSIRKFLYTGINSKTTSYMCTLKSTDEDFEKNCKEIENQFIVDKPKPTKMVYADYKNAPGANLAFFNENDYCCMGHADKPPESIYKSPETCPDIDFIIDYVRKIIVSCNDNLRMLTPRPTISPRIKATDIDRLCYCRETTWPKGAFAERFKKEAKTGPCPLCIDSGKKPKGSRAATFDIANIRGPCGKPECKIARDIRAYIEDLVDEDNEEFKIEELIGPCGSKDCTLATTIKDFLRHEGVFTHGATLEGLSTQCACIEKMKTALIKRESCESICSKDCENTTSSESQCEGLGCPFKKPKQQVYDVFYFTVEYDFENKSDNSPTPSGNASPVKTPSKPASPSPSKPASLSPSKSPSKSTGTGQGSPGTNESQAKVKICPVECPFLAEPEVTCSKDVCKPAMEPFNLPLKCIEPVCPNFHEFPPSPADSEVEIRLDEIHNMCCMKSCDTADKVKDFIADAVAKKQKWKDNEKDDPCYCDCVCTFKFSHKTTYCPVCGGYECLGDDMRYQPEHIKPHPCPVYHKMYDRTHIKTKSPWDVDDETKETVSTKSGRSGKLDKKKGGGVPEKKAPEEKRRRSLEKKEGDKPVVQESAEEEKDKQKQKSDKGEGDKKKKKKSKDEKAVVPKAPLKKEDLKYKYHYPPVPAYMGWNWAAEDIPGMKYSRGWKPGAISNRLLKKLNKAKQQTQPVQRQKPKTKTSKKKYEDKPTLIICKKKGEYHVEMQVSPEASDVNVAQCSPLVYRISREDNDERIQKRLRKRQRLVKEAVDKVWVDPYHPEICEKTCQRAYREAIGLSNPNNPDCTCSVAEEEEDECSCCNGEEEGSSDGSSLDLEWEIHFSPPIACQT